MEKVLKNRSGISLARLEPEETGDEAGRNWAVSRWVTSQACLCVLKRTAKPVLGPDSVPAWVNVTVLGSMTRL